MINNGSGTALLLLLLLPFFSRRGGDPPAFRSLPSYATRAGKGQTSELSAAPPAEHDGAGDGGTEAEAEPIPR